MGSEMCIRDSYAKGDVVQAVVSEVDVEKERISLSIKALGGDKFAEATGGVKRGSIVTVEVTAIEEGGIEVEYEGMKSFIRRSDLARDRADQRPERFNVGDKVDVRVTNVDAKTRRLGLSIKAREIAEEKEAVEQYGSSDSGASLGDILGVLPEALRFLNGVLEIRPAIQNITATTIEAAAFPLWIHSSKRFQNISASESAGRKCSPSLT